MTCIVGIEHEGRVYIGGDSAGVDSRYALTVRADAKVFVRDRFVMGFCGSFRMGQLLRYNLDPPKLFQDQDVEEFMSTSFITASRKCLKDGGHAKVESNEESGDGSFLVGFAGQLFMVESDFQVGRPSTGYAACGCGDLIALGALYATRLTAPERRIEMALQAAEAMSAGVRGPFKTVSA